MNKRKPASKQDLFDLFSAEEPNVPTDEEWDLADLRGHDQILGAVPEHTQDELEELRKGIAAFGLLGRLDVLPDKRLLDGHGRRAVLVRHFPEITKVKVRVHGYLDDDPDRQLLFGITHGLARRQLDGPARQRLAMARYEIETRLAQVRKAAGQSLGGQRAAEKRAEAKTASTPAPTTPSRPGPKPLGGNVAPKPAKVKAKKSRKAAARVAGVGERTFQKGVTLKKENAPAQRLVEAGLPAESARKLHQRLAGDPEREAALVDQILRAGPDQHQQRKELRTIQGVLKAEAEATKKAGEAARPVNVDKETAAFEEDLNKLIEPVRLARITQALVELGVSGNERAAEIAAVVLKASKVLGGMHAAVTAQPVTVANPTTKNEAGPAGEEVGHVA